MLHARCSGLKTACAAEKCCLQHNADGPQFDLLQLWHIQALSPCHMLNPNRFVSVLQGVMGQIPIDGGPARAIAAAQQGRRLFESCSFVLAAASEQQTARVDAIVWLIAFGDGLMLRLQPGKVKAVAPGAVKSSLTEHEFRRRQGTGQQGRRRFVMVCGDMRRQQVAELSQYWGTQDVVTSVYVLDSILAFELLPLKDYRVAGK